MAKRFRKKSLANKDLLEKLFSGTRIGVEDGWSVGNGSDVYRSRYETEVQFDANASSASECPDVSTPTPPFIPLSTPVDESNENLHSEPNTIHPAPNTTIHPSSAERAHPDQRSKRKRGASNIDNQSDLSKAFRERSDAIKLAASEMSSALTSDVTTAARRLHQIPEIEFGTSIYWDATSLLSANEVARRWFIGIQ